MTVHLLVVAGLSCALASRAHAEFPARPADPRQLPALVERLGHPDARVRRDGLEGLAAIARHRPQALSLELATPKLVAALRDPDASNRRLAAETLGAIRTKNPQAVEALSFALDDASPEVREAVLGALLRIGPPAAAAAPRLARMIDRNERALWVLGTIAPRQAAALFMPDLRHGSWTVRLRGAFRLGAVTPATGEVTDALSRTLRDPHAQVRAAAARSLAVHADAASIPALRVALQDAQEEVRLQVVGALGSMRPQADQVVPLLAGRLDDPAPKVRGAAVRALGPLAATSSAAAAALRRALGDHDATIRALSAQVIAGDVKGHAGPLLPELLARLEDPSSEVRVSVILALAALTRFEVGDARSLPRIRAALLDQSAAVRAAAADALVAIASAAGGRHGRDPGASGGDVIRFLFATLRQPRWQFRAAAATALGAALRETQHVPAALQRATRDRHPAVRHAAVEAIGGITRCCRRQR